MLRFNGLTILVMLLLLTSCRSAPSFNFGAYSEAERLYEKKEYQKAITKYEEHLREHPEGHLAVIARYYTAKSYEALGQWNEAGQIYRQIVKDEPKLIWANFARARLDELAQANRQGLPDQAASRRLSKLAKESPHTLP